MRLLSRLQELQSRLGYLRDEDLRSVAAEARVPLYRVQGLVSYYPHFRRAPPAQYEVSMCRDLSCHLAGAQSLCQRARERWAGVEGVELHDVSCLGRCDRAPAALVNGVPTLLADVVNHVGNLDTLTSPTRALAVGAGLNDDVVGCFEGLAGAEPHTPFDVIVRLLASNRTVDQDARPPTPPFEREEDAGIHESAAARVLAELARSGLRGMGGAGFPTATKWQAVQRETRHPKYIICNADESEPGTFKDREILAHRPHAVIEGMLLAGLVTGADQGIIYLRHEYEPELAMLEQALSQARALGLVGSNILGTSFDFSIEIFLSPGGYILGEETALLEALEDKRGEPRNKPPFPVTHGLFGQPTVINNVETLSRVPQIVDRGAEWWLSQGRPGFAGLKWMAVSGHIERPGVYEIAVGTTVAELIERAGGVSEGRALKAFAPGGASSQFLPACAASVPLDFESVAKAGSMLGSGALVVVAEGTDMAQVAANVVRFFANESCGKCVPCRLGSRQAADQLDEYVSGSAAALDQEWLRELGETLSLTSICGLGQVALNPILSVIEHFPNEVLPRLRRTEIHHGDRRVGQAERRPTNPQDETME